MSETITVLEQFELHFTLIPRAAVSFRSIYALKDSCVFFNQFLRRRFPNEISHRLSVRTISISFENAAECKVHGMKR